MPAANAVVDDILELIGETPMVRLNRMVEPGMAEVAVKIEASNPVCSVKDRIAFAMIDAAERDGSLKPGMTIVEPTSGNTGIGLALVAAAKGYRLVLTMPDSMSRETAGPLAEFRGRGGPDPGRGGHAGRRGRGGTHREGGPRRDVHAPAVRESGESRGAPPHNRARDPGRGWRGAWTRSWPAWVPAAPSRAWARS